MECFWIEFDKFGNTMTCENAGSWEAILENPRLISRIDREQRFHDIFCKYCLEGKKIQTMNDIRSFIHDQHGEEKLIKCIIDKILR